uniref:DUF4939 domain-containing protein n=1 Tax=Leptobrachium leishanense TaxID=445787 RepID=A0A8C5M7L4_9ANUR
MELSDVAGALDTISQQVSALSCSIRDLQNGHRHLQDQIHSLQTSSATSVPDPGHVPEPRVPLPERYTGRRDHYQAFITSCILLFSLNLRTYYNDYVKVRTTISLLTGEAQTWAHNLLRTQNPILDTWTSFQTAMCDMFDDPLHNVYEEPTSTPKST